MRKYERRQRRNALLKTIIGCIGWGLLGYSLMTTWAFWLGWAMLTVSLCVGAYSLDQYMKTEWRAM